MEPQQPEPLELSSGCVLAAVLAVILLLAGLFFAVPVSPRPEQLMVPPVKEEPVSDLDDAGDLDEEASPFSDPLCRPLLNSRRFMRSNSNSQ